MTIYIDIVIIENLIMNYIILLATGMVLKIEIKHIRLILASLVGAIYTVLVYMQIIPIYSNFLLKIILSFVIVYIAFRVQSIKQMWKNLLFFYLTSFVFGGTAFALLYIVKPQEILMKNRFIFRNISIKNNYLICYYCLFYNNWSLHISKN